LPRLRAVPGRAPLGDRTGNRPDPRLRGRPDRAVVPAWPLHGAGLRAGVPRSLAERRRGRLLPPPPHRAEPRAGLEELLEKRARLLDRLLRRALRHPAAAGP